MARRIALSYVRRLPCNVLSEDILQAALIGLWDGLRKRPDTPRGPGYECYLRCRIRGQIGDELRHQDWSRRKTRVTVVGLADASPFWEDTFEGTSENPEKTTLMKLDSEKAWAATLDPLDRRMLMERYVLDRNQEDIARYAGISAARVCQRQTRALLAMQHHLDGVSIQIPKRKRRTPLFVRQDDLRRSRRQAK